MKELKKDTPHLFLRLGDYENNDYIEEHIKVENKFGYVWLLKLGKTINKNYLKSIVDNNGGIIIKKTAKKGNFFYYADLINVDIYSDNNPKYPKYYDEYLYYEGIGIEEAKKNGYWFKISNIRKIDNNKVNSFIVSSNKRSVLEYALYTRVVHMYIKNDVDLKI